MSVAGLEGRTVVRSIASAAASGLAAGVGASLIGGAVIAAGLGARQVARATPLHPFGVAVGLVALPLGVALWRIAMRRLDSSSPTAFELWSLREP